MNSRRQEKGNRRQGSGSVKRRKGERNTRKGTKKAVTLYRNSLLFVRVNGMAAALAEKIKTMFYKIFNKITSFNRHYQFQPLPAQIRQPQQAILDPFVDRPVSFHEGHLLRIDDNLQKISLQLQLRAIQSIDPCTLIGVWYISQYSF